MIWLLVASAWIVSVAWIMCLVRFAGDDPLGRLDPDAPPGPVLWLVPPPLDLPVTRKPTGA